MKKKKRNFTFKFFRLIAGVFLPHIKFVTECEKPESPCIFVSNHARIYGPISWQLYSIENIAIWTAYDVIFYPEAKEYMYSYIMHAENKKPRFFYRFVATAGGKILTSLMSSVDTIPVYMGSRKIIETLNMSVQALENGVSIAIMPEKENKRDNDYIFGFFDGFVYVAKKYYEKTGKKIAFYPSYLCVQHKTLTAGKPIYYDPALSNAETAEKIRAAIYDIAMRQPPHRPVPFSDSPSVSPEEKA